MNKKNVTYQHQQLSNKPIACTFCGAEVRGVVIENINPRTKEKEKTCKWSCTRCNSLVRVGRIQ